TYPTNKIRIPVSRENVLKNGIVREKDADKILPYIDVDIKAKGGAIYIHRLMMLDIIANNNWERPIYFSGGAWDDEDFVWMKDYLQLDGMIFQLVPIKTPVPKNSGTIQMGRIDSEKMYSIIVDETYDDGTRHGWFWRGIGVTIILHNVETRRNDFAHRFYMARMIAQLLEESELD